MSNSHFKQAVLNFKVKKKSKTLCADECILNKQNTNCDIKLHDTITKHKVLSNENFRDANSVVTHNNKLFDSAIKVDKRFKTKHNVLKVHTIKPKKSISSSSPSKKIPDRPRRNLTLRKQNETSGLSWKEEIEINRALYASLQKNKSQVTFKDFSVEYLNRKEDIKSEANEDDEALFNSKKSSNKMTCLYKAQRKFASDIRSMFNDLIENKKNKQISNNSTLNKGILYTEDFINYLCLRGTQSSQIDADILNSLDINICRQPLLSSSNNLAPIQSIKPIKQSGSSQIRKVKSRKPDVICHSESKSSLQNLRAPKEPRPVTRSITTKHITTEDISFSTFHTDLPVSNLSEIKTDWEQQESESETSEEDDESSNVSSCFVHRENKLGDNIPCTTKIDDNNDIVDLTLSEPESAPFEDLNHESLGSQPMNLMHTSSSFKSPISNSQLDDNISKSEVRINSPISNNQRLNALVVNDQPPNSFQNIINIAIYPNNSYPVKQNLIDFSNVPQFIIKPFQSKLSCAPSLSLGSATSFSFNPNISTSILLNMASLNNINKFQTHQNSYLSSNIQGLLNLKPLSFIENSPLQGVLKVERILTSAVGPTLESADSKTKQSLTGTDVKQGMSSRKVHSISLRSGKSLHGMFATSGNMNLLDEGLSVKKSRNTDVLCSTNDMRKQDDDDDAGDKIIKKKVSWKTNTGSEQISSSNVSGNKLKLKSRKDSGCRKVKKRKMKYESSDRSWNRSGFKKSDMKSVTSPMTRARRRLIHGDPS